ncbi:unnamed protein product [Symbiodinium sp. CCMP2592]|nr:unnamed protein product [Symbiodinium sp. CCMP2592]
MDRDPLHDSVLEDATAAEGAEEEDAESDNVSAPTSPMTAAERAHPITAPPLHGPPNGPPPPRPVNAPPTMAHFRARRTEPSAGSSASAGVDSMGIAATWPTRVPQHAAEGAPRWHRTLAANVLHHLQLTGPAYVRAPDYAEVATWRSLLISLREATPAEEYMLEPTNPQDLRNPLFDPPDDDEDHDDQEVDGMEQAQESEGPTHDPNTSDSDSNEASEVAAVRPSSAPLAMTSTTTTLPPVPAHLDPAEHTGLGPDAAGMLYESEDGLVCFDLGQATECLQATRERLHMYREDHRRNRHRESSTQAAGPESRSRSRSPAPDSSTRWSLLVLIPIPSSLRTLVTSNHAQAALPGSAYPPGDARRLIGLPHGTHTATQPCAGGKVSLSAKAGTALRPVSTSVGASATDSASTTSRTLCRPGPKSRGLLSLYLRGILLLTSLQSARAGQQPEARVATLAAEVAGGATLSHNLPASSPKPGGFPATTRPALTMPYSRSAKRAYQRACNRAINFGHTRYRGRTLLASQVPAELRPVGPSGNRHAHPRPRPSPCSQDSGLHIMSWNAGGLGAGGDLYSELMNFLTNSTLDLAVIQETRWTECLEFTSGPWTCLHSGCRAHKQGGVLVLVHSRVTAPSRIRYEHLLRGRLIHVRVPLPGADHRHIHILATYQKTHDPRNAQALPLRRQVWNALHKCLRNLPARDQVVLIGDFNTTLREMTPHVGRFVGAPLAHPPEDIPDFEALLTTYNLVALNTWYPSPGGQSTFHWGEAQSQIDYIIVRRGDAPTVSRKVRLLRGTPLGASRRSGAYHVPLATRLPTSKPYWLNVGKPRVPKADQEALLAALDNPCDLVSLGKIAGIRLEVSRHIARHSTSSSILAGIQSLHTVMHQACCHYFPPNAPKAGAPPWQTGAVQQGVKDMWQKWRAFKQVRKQGLRGWFQAWKAWKAYNKQYQEHQRRCKAARKSVLLTAMQEAEQHALKHNSRGIYQIVKRLAPKQARRQMQLRSSDGQMLSPSEELELLREHFQTRFTASQPMDASLADLHWPCAQHPLLEAQPLCQAIQSVPRRKAVPQGHPPSASWRLCADLLAPWLSSHLNEAWCQTAIQVPRCWSDVDLALVPKPEKSGREPKDYRPIGLACPLGKKLLAALVQPHVAGLTAQMQSYPQYAYQAGRSQLTALRRVFSHCAQVRLELQKHRKDLHQRFAGAVPVPLFGAMMVTIDLTQAFDKMPRSKLYAGMRHLALPDDLIHVLMQWHAGIHYTIHHDEASRTFRATQGIRQGCSVAPLLWLIFSHEVNRALANQVGYDLVCRLLTVFADDYHVADSFHSLVEFEALLSVLGVLFRILAAFGMQVSDSKSRMVLALRGSLSNTIRRKYVRPNPNGEGKVLRIHTSTGQLNLPLVDSFVYLGARVSYGPFENQTLEHRLAKGDATYHRLGKVLKGRHHLSTRQRVHLWRSCVWSAVSYSLTACGLTEAGLQRLNTAMVKQLRAILRLPAHITLTTNAQVCQAAGLLLPHQQLLALLDTEGHRLESEPPSDLICHPKSDWWKQVRTSFLYEVPASLTRLPEQTQKAWSCPHCGLHYPSRATLKTHIAKKHADVVQADRPTFSRLEDAVNGLPQCRHCLKKFPTWQLLSRHIEGNHCADRVQDPAAREVVETSPNQPELLSADVQKGGSEVALAHHAHMQALLLRYGRNMILHLQHRQCYHQHCLICGQWTATSKVMKTHYKGTHPQLHSLASQATKLCQSFPSGGTPCQYCGVTAESEQPHKAVRLNNLGKRGRPQEPLPNNPPSNPSGWQGGGHSKGKGRGGQRGQTALIKAMGRLLIRQETSLQVLEQNSAWNMYLQPGQQGPLPLLFKTSEAYRQEAQTKHMEMPLRAQLLHTLFQTVLQCVQALGTDQEQQKAAQDRGWLTSEGKWAYQRWDPAAQALIVDPDRAPLEHQELIALLGAMADAVKRKDVIHKFNATHTVAAEQTGPSKFMLEVGLRAMGVAEVWTGLEKLQSLSALQLCGVQLRRDGLQRCSLANDIQKMLGEF